MNSAVDRIPVEHIIQEDRNNEIQPSTPKNNAINLTINMDQYIYIQSCPKKDKNCLKGAKQGHFAEICRSANVKYMFDGNGEQQEEIETESLETDKDTVAFAEFTSKNGCDDYQIDKFLIMSIAEALNLRTRLICLRMT